jgi:hypothetical protein
MFLLGVLVGLSAGLVVGWFVFTHQQKAHMRHVRELVSGVPIPETKVAELVAKPPASTDVPQKRPEPVELGASPTWW